MARKRHKLKRRRRSGPEIAFVEPAKLTVDWTARQFTLFYSETTADGQVVATRREDFPFEKAEELGGNRGLEDRVLKLLRQMDRIDDGDVEEVSDGPGPDPQPPTG